MALPLLQLTSVTKSFGAVRALKGVSFDLRASEVHALLGENGAGKSTLIKIITGAHQPDSGTIEVNGLSIAQLTPATAQKLGIACIYQQPALFPDLSVAENIGLRLEQPRPFARVDWTARRIRAAQLLQRIGAEISPEAEVRSLSMPQQQLVEIACALGAGARIVIMDEPTASLTQQEQHFLFAVVRDLRQRGVGVIYISHRLEEIFAIADRVTVLRDGESVGTRHVSYNRVHKTPDSVERESGSTSVAAITERELIKLMVGREVSTMFPPAECERGQVVLSLKNLGCTGSGVKDITLDVHAGEVVGLAGLVGAGRTELARILFGLTPCDAGQIILNGQRVTIASPQDAIAFGIAYLPEDRRRQGIILEMSIAHNVTMAIHRRIFPATLLRFGAERSLTQEFIRELAVKASGPDAPGGSLSGGNQQKVALARWLATKPKLLILDEPTQGVDVGAKTEIHRIIRRLTKGGVAVLMISSDLPEVIGMSDRIAVLRGGTITAMLPGQSDPHAVMAAALGQVESAQVESAHVDSDQVDSDEAETGATGLKRYFRELSVAATLGVMLLLLAVFAPNFFEPQPLLSRLAAAAPKLVLAMGVGLVIISRQIDISIGSLFAVCGTCAGLAATANLPWPIAVLVAVSVGSIGGAINGLLVAGLRLPSIVVTLATMVTLREGLRLMQQGVFINLPDGMQWFGMPMTAGQLTVCGVALGLLVLMSFAMKNLSIGRFVYAVGSDTEAARLAGIRPQWITFLVFASMGTLTGIAAVLNLVQSPQVDPNSGRGLELEAIAAAVVGGVAVSGGKGRLWGVLTGLLLLVCISPALTYVGVKPYWEKAIQGAIILLAVVTDGLRSQTKPLLTAKPS